MAIARALSMLLVTMSAALAAPLEAPAVRREAVGGRLATEIAPDGSASLVRQTPPAAEAEDNPTPGDALVGKPPAPNPQPLAHTVPWVFTVGKSPTRVLGGGCSTQYVLQGPTCSQACVDESVDALVHGVHGLCSDEGFVLMLGEFNVEIFAAGGSEAPAKEALDSFFESPYCNPHSVLKGEACEEFCLPEAQWAASQVEHIENATHERCGPRGYSKLVGTKTVTLYARHHSDIEETEAADGGQGTPGHEGDAPQPQGALLVDSSNNALEAKRVAQAELAAAGGVKHIAGVPIYHYRHAHPSGMHPSTLELAEQREWVLKLPENFTDEQARSFCAPRTGSAKCTLEARPSEGWPFLTIRAAESELEQLLRDNPGAESGEPEMALEPIPEIPEDPKHLFKAAALGAVTHGLDRIDSKDGLDEDYSGGGPNGGAGVHVYVLDTGVRTTHQDFGGRADGDADVGGHGSHCAGTIGGATWGVAKKATIHSIRVCARTCHGMSHLAYKMEQIVRDHNTGGKYAGKPAVISMSLGGRGWCGHSMTHMAKRLAALGISVMASAGNDNSDACLSSPANCPGFVTVGSVFTAQKNQYFDRKSGFSNWGRCVDVWAPGEQIDSAAHTSDTGSVKMSGTSMSGPHVSGVLAVLSGQGHTGPSSKYPGYTKAAEQLIDTATPGKVKGDPGHVVNNKLLYIAPTQPPSRRRRSGGGGGKTPCFGREASFAFASAAEGGPWRAKKMVELKAGDYVLASDKDTGVPFADRVLTNLHVRDPSKYPLLEIRHTLGSVTVTPDHVMFVDGDFRAARFVKPSSSMLATRLRPAELGQRGLPGRIPGTWSAVNVTVLAVTPHSGRIINPLTHSGLILVATASGEADVGLLATTVLESPGNAMLAMAQYPGMGKVASYLFPRALQESTLTEEAILLMGQASSILPSWLGLPAFLLFDVLTGLAFVAWHSGWALGVCAALLGARAVCAAKQEAK